MQQRFHAPHKRYGPEEMSPELREAMTHVKRAAVQHRNNHIGTEHLLFGLTAEPDSATRLLESAGVSPSDVHDDVGARLTMGASQAAERIDWTPYSRKAIALAEARSEEAGAGRIGCDDPLFGLALVGRGSRPVSWRTRDSGPEPLRP
ncbi:Clp protease N-terminal domain-containing protein [Streptomyces sp. NPDC005760]|uniref:Clp protease N-terminal domain-containing protein n=1 Tax=Streptomyces sp. NPDC005760 TaxID=3156718 RepID=UPI0033EF0FB2